MYEGTKSLQYPPIKGDFVYEDYKSQLSLHVELEIDCQYYVSEAISPCLLADVLKFYVPPREDIFIEYLEWFNKNHVWKYVIVSALYRAESGALWRNWLCHVYYCVSFGVSAVIFYWKKLKLFLVERT